MPDPGESPSMMALATGVASGEISPRTLIRDTLDAIHNDSLHSFLTVPDDQAMREASKAEARQMRGGPFPPLLGVPIGIKDLHETAGIRTTYGSIRHAAHVPDQDCLLVARLRAAGAIVVGKTNTPAFGLISETKNRFGPACANPYDQSRTAGGSSGGSAAAVATRLVPGATGSDAAGSINVPAAYCGVYGFKPSLGLVPNVPAGDSLLLFCASGPITRTVEDAALMLEVMAGYDPRDPMSRPMRPVPYLTAANADLALPLRVAFSEDLGLFAVDEELRDATKKAALQFEALGCDVSEAAPALEDPMGLYMGLYVSDSRRFVLNDPEYLAELYPESISELRDLPEASAENYVILLNRLWRLKAAMVEFFREHDLLIIPTTATPAFPHDQPPSVIGGQAVEPGWTTFMPFTPIANLTGQPAANLPCGFAQSGLPLGVLLIGRVGEDGLVLQASRALLGR